MESWIFNFLLSYVKEYEVVWSDSHTAQVTIGDLFFLLNPSPLQIIKTNTAQKVRGLRKWRS